MKKILTLVIALVMVIGMTVPAFAAELNGGPDNLNTASVWAQDAIAEEFDGGFLSYMDLQMIYHANYAQTQRGISPGEGRIFLDRQIIASTSDFKADITRGEFAKMMMIWVMYATETMPADLLTRMGQDYILGSTNTNPPCGRLASGQWWIGVNPLTHSFHDVKFGYRFELIDNKIYQNGIYYSMETGNDFPPLLLEDTLIEYAYRLGIVSGTKIIELESYPDCPDRWFNPNDTLTREQAATMVVRAINFVNFVKTHETYTETELWAAVRASTNAADAGYSDSISSWAKDAVNFCAANGYMSGVGDNRFDAKSNYTIEQAILVLSRISLSSGRQPVRYDTKVEISQFTIEDGIVWMRKNTAEMYAISGHEMIVDHVWELDNKYLKSTLEYYNAEIPEALLNEKYVAVLIAQNTAERTGELLGIIRGTNINGITYISAEDVAELFGATMVYSEATRKLSICK